MAKKVWTKIPPQILILTVTLGIAVTLVSTYIIVRSVTNFNSAVTIKPVESKYIENIKTENTLASKAVESIFTDIAPNSTKTTSTLARLQYDPKICPTPYDPTPIVFNQTVTSTTKTVTIDVFTPGYAPKIFNQIKSNLQNCNAIVETEASYIKTEQGTIFSQGDLIVGVKTGIQATKEEIETIQTAITKALNTTSCKNLNPTIEDYQRNPFFDKNVYKGLYKTETITPTFPVKGLENYRNPINIPTVTNPYRLPPEAPLPPQIPETIPTPAPPKPSPPTPPAEPSEINKAVSYRIPDPAGPGCGWAFLGYSPPKYNQINLGQEKTETISAAVKEVDLTAAQFIQKNASWFIDATLNQALNLKWDKYVKEINQIHEKWESLEQAREAYYPTYLEYLRKFSEYNNWDKNREEAEKNYTEALQKCQKIQEEYQQWETEHQTTPPPSPTPTHDTSPPTLEPSPALTPPPSCPIPPELPEILHATKPLKPEPLRIPEGLTIPKSWDKPEGIEFQQGNGQLLATQSPTS